MGWLFGVMIVLLGWGVGLGLLTTLGLLPARLAAPRVSPLRQLRGSLWWGLLILTLIGYAVSIWLPLASPRSLAIVAITALALGIPGWWLLIRRLHRRAASQRVHQRWSRQMWTPSWPVMVWWLGVAIAVVTLAIAALGPVTHFDAGLYQLGAIRYAAEYPAIRGIANLYGPLGYSNAEPVLAALAGNGPWGAAGYRLVNGFVMAILAADLLLRSLAHRMRGSQASVGWWVLVIGIFATWIPMVAMADFWVSSPTADSAVLMVSLATVATLADQVRRPSRADLASVIVLSTMLVLLRPTMVIFACASVAVAVGIGWRRQRGRIIGPVLVAGAVAVIAGALLAIRDLLLSGWLQYPLSVFAFDVLWRAADPEGLRVATLGFARNPADIWGSIQGWSWVGPWAGRLPGEWAFWLAVLLAAAATCAMALAARRGKGRTERVGLRPMEWRGLLITTAPALVAVLVWWATSPPALRFIWGPLFAIGILPLAWGLQVLGWRRLVLTTGGLAIAGFSLFTLALRVDWQAPRQEQAWLGVSVPVARLPVVEVTQRTLPSGLRILQPTQSDQCWAAYPLCSPTVPDSLRPIQATWSEGFLP